LQKINGKGVNMSFECTAGTIIYPSAVI